MVMIMMVATRVAAIRIAAATMVATKVAAIAKRSALCKTGAAPPLARRGGAAFFLSDFSHRQKPSFLISYNQRTLEI